MPYAWEHTSFKPRRSLTTITKFFPPPLKIISMVCGDGRNANFPAKLGRITLERNDLNIFMKQETISPKYGGRSTLYYWQTQWLNDFPLALL